MPLEAGACEELAPDLELARIVRKCCKELDEPDLEILHGVSASRNRPAKSEATDV